MQGDSTRLSQVLQNLLVNAAKYTPEGGRIQLRAYTADSFVYLAVADNGRGLAPEHLQRHLPAVRAGRHGHRRLPKADWASA